MRGIASVALLVVLPLGLPGAFAQSASFKVVVNSTNSVTSLPRAELSRIFMKKLATWEDGRTAVPVDQSEGSSARRAFSKAVHKQDTNVIKAYWVRQVFSGRMIPPAELASDADVVAFVKANAGAVGYVSAGASTAGVKVVGVSEED